MKKITSDIIVNEMSPEEVADSKDLPLAAVKEAIVVYKVLPTTQRKPGFTLILSRDVLSR
jgi:hypothetical protein